MVYTTYQPEDHTRAESWPRNPQFRMAVRNTHMAVESQHRRRQSAFVTQQPSLSRARGMAWRGVHRHACPACLACLINKSPGWNEESLDWVHFCWWRHQRKATRRLPAAGHFRQKLSTGRLFLVPSQSWPRQSDSSSFSSGILLRLCSVAAFCRQPWQTRGWLQSFLMWAVGIRRRLGKSGLFGRDLPALACLCCEPRPGERCANKHTDQLVESTEFGLPAC